MNILPQLVLNSIIAASTYALMALGFNLIYDATKFFNLAHGVVAAIGGYTVFLLTKSFHVGMLPSIAAGVVVAGLVGYVLEKMVYLPLRTRKASNMILLVASLGVFTALQAVLAIIFTSQFQTLATNVGTQKLYDIAGGVITQTQLIMFCSALGVFAGLWALLAYTRFGKAVRAISDDAEVAKMVGINTDAVIGRVFFVGSAIAGLAGILVGLDTGLEPTMGMTLLLGGVIAAIVGGIGSVRGSLVGAFVLGFVENFGIWKIAAEWKSAIAFSLLIVFLLFRPQGIFKK